MNTQSDYEYPILFLREFLKTNLIYRTIKELVVKLKTAELKIKQN